MEAQTLIINKIPKIQSLLDIKKSQRVQQNILKLLKSRHFTRKTQLLQFRTYNRNDINTFGYLHVNQYFYKNIQEKNYMLIQKCIKQ
ncbi:hypothetical protein pb186bvf_011323 [Paramecium bursaria]